MVVLRLWGRSGAIGEEQEEGGGGRRTQTDGDTDRQLTSSELRSGWSENLNFRAPNQRTMFPYTVAPVQKRTFHKLARCRISSKVEQNFLRQRRTYTFEHMFGRKKKNVLDQDVFGNEMSEQFVRTIFSPQTGCFFRIGALVFEVVLSCETRGPIL